MLEAPKPAGKLHRLDLQRLGEPLLAADAARCHLQDAGRHRSERAGLIHFGDQNTATRHGPRLKVVMTRAATPGAMAVDATPRLTYDFLLDESKAAEVVDRLGEISVGNSLDTVMVATMRCLLALVALLVGVLNAGFGTSPSLLYGALLAYSAYSLALLVSSVRGHAPFQRAHPWLDTLFFAILVALTGGSASVFFHYFLFAIIVASFSRGFPEGLWVTVCAVAAFTGVGLANYALAGRMDGSDTVIRSASLFLLGYLVAYWGGQEIALRERLSLLRELSTLADPRAQPERVMDRMLGRLIDFFEASSCVLIVPIPGAQNCALYRSRRPAEGRGLQSDKVGEHLAAQLLSLPADIRITFDSTPSLIAGRPPQLSAWGPNRERCDAGCASRCLELSILLEAPIFTTVPFKQSDAALGRFYMVSPARRLSAAETEFLVQATTQIATAINNMALFDELTRSTAQTERARISRDIHDTTVQSYIGLKIALEALYRDIEPGTRVGSRVKELLDMATLTVDDLRRYIDRLSGRAPAAPEQELMARLQEQQRRYRDYHGMNVELRTPEKLELSDEVAGEAYRVVCEALSNVFRHTRSREAFVDLQSDGATLSIEVGNDSSHKAEASFIPRSITERASSIGGKVQVHRNEGRDIVRVTVPLDGRKKTRPVIAA